ncbi:MAG: topoisomerase C-terminal repeat-containing protein, partial [Oscillospiraceae bacterium]|nr:topoisomerase C-terminal repeat-containing protein [Oscillospiraceae bacterium]
SGYKEGCKFSVGEICGKKITESQVISLITKGKTSVIKGFTAKSGKKFDAALWLDKNTGKINFEFLKK